MSATDTRIVTDAHGASRAAHVVLLVGLGLLFGLFVALAVWQVERRSLKLALIERVDQRVHAPPVEAPRLGDRSRLSASTDEYRHVRVTGTFLRGRDTMVQAVTDLGNGYWVVTPLLRIDGQVVLVNRGFVAADHRMTEAGASAAASSSITGLLRITEPGGGFLQHNDASANRWYSRDVKAIAAARGLQDVAPYFIDADRESSIDADELVAAMSLGVPIGGLTVVSFPNNHLLYAIVWTMLALMTAWAGRQVLVGAGRPARREDSPDEGLSDDASNR